MTTRLGFLGTGPELPDPTPLDLTVAIDPCTRFVIGVWITPAAL
ncbi:MAG TPA: hypothetical protein VGS21_11785 [Acidimicrobiales bacterium]|nr:hypothetical protein [Acidimicrobiales bacterium]